MARGVSHADGRIWNYTSIMLRVELLASAIDEYSSDYIEMFDVESNHYIVQVSRLFLPWKIQMVRREGQHRNARGDFFRP